LIGAIAIPAVSNFVESSKETVCRQRLKVIDDAKLQWAIDKNEPDTAEPTVDDLEDYVRGEVPTGCIVAGALYKIGNIITPAWCSFHGNGFSEGLGFTAPPALTHLIASGDLTTPDVVDSDWSWEAGVGEGGGEAGEICIYHLPSSGLGKVGSVYRSIAEIGHDGMNIKDKLETDSGPKLTINGNVLKGDEIYHFSEEYIASGRRLGSIAFAESANLRKHMPQGGYAVIKNHGDLKADFYDDKGNYIRTVSYQISH
jgi:hypothetical protein